MLLEDGRWRPEGWHQNHRCYHRCAEQGRTSDNPMSREGKSDDVIDRPALQLVYGDKARQERYARGGRAKIIDVLRFHPIARGGGNIVHSSPPICSPFLHPLSRPVYHLCPSPPPPPQLP